MEQLTTYVEARTVDGPDERNTASAQIPMVRAKAKRDIIRFTGEKPMAINLEHLTGMYIEGKRITFEFYTKAQFFDFADDASASSAFEAILNTWAADVLE